jgi:hypothetical protein
VAPAERPRPGDDEWLPPDLRSFAGPLPVSEPPPPVRLYRLLPAGGGAASGDADAPRHGVTGAAGDLPARAVRWAAYIDAPVIPDVTGAELR